MEFQALQNMALALECQVASRLPNFSANGFKLLNLTAAGLLSLQ